MKKEDFKKLLSSIQEAADIKAGRKAPGRVFESRHDLREMRLHPSSIIVDHDGFREQPE